MRPIAVPTFAAALLLSLVFACGGDGDTGGPGGDGGDGGGGTGGDGGTGGGGSGGGSDTCGELPAIDALEPDHGTVGSRVKIHGRGFAVPAGLNRVLFGGQESTALSVDASCTLIETVVPVNATTGKVKLVVAGVNVDGPTFTVDPVPAPHLTALEPDRVAVGEGATIALVGSDFRPTARILFDGQETNGRYVSSTRLELVLTASTLSRPETHTLQVVVAPPGGGSSELLSFEVVRRFQLEQAEATSLTGVSLRFEQPLRDEDLTDVSNYSIDPPLNITAAVRDGEVREIVHLTTVAQGAGTRYRISARPNLVSEVGDLLASGTVLFRAFGSPPDQVQVIPKSGCDGFAVSGPGAISRAVGGGFYLVERTGHQVQIVDNQPAARGYLGHNGTDARRHDGVGDNAAGCPDETGSDAEGAFRNPRGAVLRTSNGDLLVADTGNGRVQRWSVNGAYLRSHDGYTAPVLLGSLDSHVAVADVDDFIHRAAENMNPFDSFGGTGDTLGKFRFGIAEGETPAMVEIPFSSPRTVYLTDPLNHRVVLLQDGEPVGFLGGGVAGFRDQGSCCAAGEGAHFFDRPRGLAWGDGNKLWVIDSAKGGRIQRFSAGGDPEYEYVLGFLPGGLALGRNDLGEYWLISDPAADRVYLFQP